MAGSPGGEAEGTAVYGFGDGQDVCICMCG